MKNLSVPTVLAAMLAMSNGAQASDHAQLRQYAALSTAAGDNGTGEVDHNADNMVMDGPAENDSYDMPSVPAPEAPAPSKVLPKPIVKSPMAQKSDSAAEVPAPKSKKVKAAPAAREIPLIETDNPVESSPDVNYVTGGIGEDEKASIEAAKADYNVHVMSASANGAFVGDARVVISSKNGSESKEVLNVVAGPLLYVKLPAGSYSLDASLGEQKKHQNFTIGAKSATANVHLAWQVPATRSDQ